MTKCNIILQQVCYCSIRRTYAASWQGEGKGNIVWLMDIWCNWRVVSLSLPFYHPSNMSFRQFSPFLSKPDSLLDIHRSQACLFHKVYLWFAMRPYDWPVTWPHPKGGVSHRAFNYTYNKVYLQNQYDTINVCMRFLSGDDLTVVVGKMCVLLKMVSRVGVLGRWGLAARVWYVISS